MKPNSITRLLFLIVLLAAPSLLAEEIPAPPAPTWHPQSLGHAVANMVIFAAVGLACAVVGFKLFDKCTPGNLTKEIIENKNVAAAIVAGAVILGVSLIIAASIVG
jgi:putative membrane protein